MTHTLKSLSKMNDAIEPSMIPIKQIQAVSESSAGYFFKVNDCTPQNSNTSQIISSCINLFFLIINSDDQTIHNFIFGIIYRRISCFMNQ